LPDTGPPSTAGFVFLDRLFSVAGAVPANLPVGRDLTIRRKIENGRYYCALVIESGHHVALNPGPEAAEAAVCRLWYPNRPAFDVSAGLKAGYGRGKYRRLPAAAGK